MVKHSRMCRVRKAKRKFSGTEGQDRESYSDTQDRKSYTCR